jgi:hypothetical protein
MRRVLDVARMTANWTWIFVWPLGILALTLVLNVAIFALIGDAAPPEGRVTGALMSIYIVLLVSHVQTMTQVFPFALGMSVTRRAFYAATALLVTAQAVVFGTALVVLDQLERVTGGWGVGVRFFGLPFVQQDGVFAQWLVYTVPFLACSAVGVVIGVIFKRWGQAGLFVAGIGATVALAGLAMLVTWRQWWPAVGSFFTGQSTFALLTVYPLLIALVLGGAGWVAVRRATP